LTLNIGGLDRPTFEDNFIIINKKNNERIEQAKNAPVLKIWAEILIKLRNTAVKIESKELKPKAALSTIITISVEELNKLPSFADEMRTSIAYMLRTISVAMWNEHRAIEEALKTLDKALSINLPAADKSKISADLIKLKEIEKEKDVLGKPIKSAPTLRLINGCGTTMFGKTLYFVIIGIPIIPIARYNCEQTYEGYSFYGKLKLKPYQRYWQYAVIGFCASLILFS
jgi:hypothetical protein